MKKETTKNNQKITESRIKAGVKISSKESKNSKKKKNINKQSPLLGDNDYHEINQRNDGGMFGFHKY